MFKNLPFTYFLHFTFILIPFILIPMCPMTIQVVALNRHLRTVKPENLCLGLTVIPPKAKPQSALFTCIVLLTAKGRGAE